MDVEGTTILSIRRKIVFIGNPSTGKTSLLNRICNDKFLPDYDSTIGVDFSQKQFITMKTFSKFNFGIPPAKKNTVR